MPANTVYVGRGSRWGNRFVVGKDGSAEECIAKHAEDLLSYSHRGPHNGMGDFLLSQAILDELERDLRGKNLACWCALDQPCHADLLLRWANEPTDEKTTKGENL